MTNRPGHLRSNAFEIETAPVELSERLEDRTVRGRATAEKTALPEEIAVELIQMAREAVGCSTADSALRSIEMAFDRDGPLCTVDYVLAFRQVYAAVAA